MPSKRRKVNGIAAERLKAIRPYVSFDYDLRKPLTRAQKRRIKEYHDEISGLTNRPYQVYRPRRADHLEQAQHFAQHEKRLPALKVAFLPSNGTDHITLSFGKNGPIARTKYVTTNYVAFNKDALIVNADDEVNRKLLNVNAQQFTIAAGKYEIPRGMIRATVNAEVKRLMARYDGVNNAYRAQTARRRSNQYWGNWLHGVRVYQYQSQGDLNEYFRDKKAAIKTAKRARRAERERDRRARQKREDARRRR